MTSDDALIEAMAYTLTGHICGQCACSNRRGWADPNAKGCACRDAAQDALKALRKTHAVVSREALQDIDAIARTSVGPGYSAILSHTRAMLSAGESHDD